VNARIATAHESERALLLTAALLFFGSAAVTLGWCGSMASMPGMAMPGGWTMSMAWMLMPGQSWAGAAGSFIGMWTVMMVAMMLPVFLPALWQYRQALRIHTGPRRGQISMMMSLGYFSVWTLLGAAAFPVGFALAELEMRLPLLARAVPVIAGVVIVLAGLLQVSAWKARQLASCRRSPTCGGRTAGSVTAWRAGLSLGMRCCYCCAPMTSILFVTGVMDMRAMALVTAAIMFERLMPRAQVVARRLGYLTIAAGLLVCFEAIVRI
jgi:predicted metal-binding membrane protein